MQIEHWTVLLIVIAYVLLERYLSRISDSLANIEATVNQIWRRVEGE